MTDTNLGGTGRPLGLHGTLHAKEQQSAKVDLGDILRRRLSRPWSRHHPHHRCHRLHRTKNLQLDTPMISSNGTPSFLSIGFFLVLSQSEPTPPLPTPRLSLSYFIIFLYLFRSGFLRSNISTQVLSSIPPCSVPRPLLGFYMESLGWLGVWWRSQALPLSFQPTLPLMTFTFNSSNWTSLHCCGVLSLTLNLITEIMNAWDWL